MIDWENLSVFLEKRLTPSEVQLVKQLLTSLSFAERQNLMLAMIAFPGKIPFFIELVMKKQKLAGKYNERLAKEILELEKTEFTAAFMHDKN